MAEIKIETTASKDRAKTSTKSALDPVISKKDMVVQDDGYFKKMAKKFLKKDLPDIGSYILDEVIIPGIRDAGMDIIYEIFSGIGGRSSHGSSRSRYDRASYRSYDSYYGRGRCEWSRSNRDRDYSSTADTKLDWHDVKIRDRRAAEKVVNRMRERIDECGEATVADLCRLLGLESEWVDANWGWTNPRDIGLKATRDGFMIDAAKEHEL